MRIVHYLELMLPTVVRLGSLKIMVFAGDHNPPHFHIVSAEYAAVVSLESLEVIAGYVPKQSYEMAKRWATNHMDVLHAAWAQLND